jgi:hypothetical protein
MTHIQLHNTLSHNHIIHTHHTHTTITHTHSFYEHYRSVAPYSVAGLEYFSTALWHVKNETKLAFLVSV